MEEAAGSTSDIFSAYAEATESLEVSHFGHFVEQDTTKWLSPFLPSSTSRISRFLDIAGVTSPDVIADFGCGDGRVLIYAALNIGCEGIGLDISNECIGQAVKMANDLKVAEKISFFEKDLTSDTLDTEVDFSCVTVVVLYFYRIDMLYPMIEKLFKRNQGLRVVTFEYHFSGWAPDLHDEEFDINVYSSLPPCDLTPSK